MVMVGHSKRLAQPLRWGRRERIAVVAVAVLAVLGLVAVGVAALASGGARAPAAGCVSTTASSYTGGVTVRVCGAGARELCASRTRVGDVGALRAQCLRGGYAFRAPAGTR
jgi:hypothetical protein